MHALPGGNREGRQLMATGPWDQALLNEPVRRHARRLDLRARPSGAQSAAVRAEVFPGRASEAAR